MTVLEYQEIKMEQLYQSKTIHFSVKVFISVATESKLPEQMCLSSKSTVPEKYLKIFRIYMKI